MNFNEYQQQALMADNKDLDPIATKMIASLELLATAGKVADLVRRNVNVRGQKMDEEKLCEQLGDMLSDIAALSWKYGIPLEGVAQTNIVRLQERYPERFGAEAPINSQSD